jgi:GDPmannose 4,6-dehydratase
MVWYCNVGVDFVTRKITRSIAFMECGKLPHIELGNLDAQRDWGHSKDYVRGIHLMLQHHTPRDFVLASGEARSVRDFVIEAFRVVGKDLW